MPRESQKTRLLRARRILRSLFRTHPDAHCALDYRNAYELLAATILSAQCTDKMVNSVTPQLFEKFPDPASLARADVAEVEAIVRPTGFYKNKAKSLLGMAKAVVEVHGGAIPDSLDELVRLPGVGRKTANVILGNAFGTPGLVVDTHVSRIAQRLGLTAQKDPVKIENELMGLLPRKHWTQFSHAMIFHGRRICVARKPRCEECPLAKDCPHAPAGREV